MENNYLLNQDYIRIKNMNTVSYGGNQTWCKNRKLQTSGCGVVALADITIYLAEQNPACMTDAIRKINKPKGLYNKNDYLAYVNWFYKHYIFFLWHMGMTGITLMNTLNRYFMLNDIGLRARWKLFLSDDAMMTQIRHLIRKNKPVVLSVGPNFPNPFGGKGINLYVRKDGKLLSSMKQDVHSHFVVVTGVEEIEGSEYLIISSWGKKYYINYAEYREYVRHTGWGFTSSILYIKGMIS